MSVTPDIDSQDQFLQETARTICKEQSISNKDPVRVESSDHAVFFIGNELVLKIYRPVRNCFEREKKGLEFASAQCRFLTPSIVDGGNFDGHDYLVLTRIPGRQMDRAAFLSLKNSERIEILSALASGLRELHENEPAGFVSDWAEFVADQASTFIERQIGHGVNSKIIDQLPEYIEESLPLVPLRPTVFLHGDVHLGNLRFDGTPSLSGLFDFADSRTGWREYDLLAVGVLMIQGEREMQREFFRAYGYDDEELNEEMRRRMMMLTILYETSDLRRYAMRLRSDAVDLDLYELEKSIWSFV